MKHTDDTLKSHGSFQFTSRSLAEDYLLALPYPYEADLRATATGYTVRYWLSPNVLAASKGVAE